MKILKKIVKNWIITFILPLIILERVSVAEVLDGMESSANWEIQTDEGAALSTSTVTGSVGNAIRFDYDIGSGDWVAIKREDFANVDVSGGDAISFYYKGSGDSNHIKFQITDGDGDVFDRKLSDLSNISNWTRAILTFESLSHWEGTGDGTLDTASISKIAFAINVSEGGTGRIAIDALESYQLNTPSVSLLVDNFNCGSPPNDLGGNGGIFDPNPNDPTETCTVSYDRDSKEGPYALKLVYDRGAGSYCGYWTKMESDGSGRDISGFTGGSLKFWVKGENGGEKFKVELHHEGGSAPWPTVQLTACTGFGSGASTTYREASMPLASFAGLDLTKVTELVITFDQMPNSGTVYIDRIRFAKSGTSLEGSITSLDNMDEPAPISGWKNYGADEDKGITTTSLDSISGKEGNGLELTYRFNRGDTDDWVVMERDWGRNIARSDSFKFKYKGTGNANDLQLRVVDKNDTVYSKEIFSITDTGGEWETAKIPYEEFGLMTSGTYGNGDTATGLDLTKIEGVLFVVNKGEGGSGTLIIDELEVLEINDFKKGRGDSLIKRIIVPDNPISPNGDGIKDRASFKFELARYASVSLKIYDLAGNLIRKIDAGEKEPDVEHTIYWDARDNSEDLVRNGLYFYIMEAKDLDRKTDRVKHIIGVIR